MGLSDELEGQIVGLDTAPLIYFIERQPSYIDIVRPIFKAVDEGKIQIVTSTVTLLEVLVQPIRRGDEALAYRYNDILLTSPNISTTPVTPSISQIAAELRAEYRFKTPGSIQLATAIASKATTFLTNDRDFAEVPGIRIVRLSDFLTERA